MPCDLDKKITETIMENWTKDKTPVRLLKN